MSYAEFLRRKAASEPVIVNTKKVTDASMMTQKKRFESNRVFSQVQSQFIGSLRDGKDGTGYPPGFSHPSTSFVKGTGRPADASDFTSWRGGQGIGNDAAYDRGKFVVQPSCVGCIPAAPRSYKTASTITHEKVYTQNGCAEPHTQGKLGAVFVDDTIRLSSGAPKAIISTCCYPAANHNIKEYKSVPLHSARPDAPGMVVNPGGVFTSPGTGRKVGSIVPSDYPKYIEKHHGNDLFVNRKQPFVKYQIPAGTPAQLKINDPTFANVKP